MNAPRTTGTAARRPTGAARRVGYSFAVLANGLLLVLIHGWPGWETVPFLTPETVEVLPLVNASIVVGIAANVVYLVVDPLWLRALGDVMVTVVGLVATVAVWRVFPFDFTGWSFDWTLVIRILLVVAIVGSAIGIITGIARLVTVPGRHR
ncbi:hypothetical protein [Isoptericola sediminis]|uniref:Uncharacterized protein n=1 Tax=Isoptericola sediminis TaxID=2733572 RepID=A0A849JWP7_9MICO|nr:hypothetical protein [Isoptericola sediminis]NNU27732.1 hypothetical protein [Isoptericola sediminis]